MSDTTFTPTPTDLTDVVETLREIRDCFPGNVPVVVSTLSPPSDCQHMVCNGVEHKVIALVVWSTGKVTPMYKVPGRGHIRILGPDEIWHFAMSEVEAEQ